MGFAKRYDLSPEKLEIRETSKGSFVFAKSIEKGKPVASLLAGYLPGWISKIQGRRFMRWGKGDFRFSRPIRWIVSLLDSEIIDFTISGSQPEISKGKTSESSKETIQRIGLEKRKSPFPHLINLRP